MAFSEKLFQFNFVLLGTPVFNSKSPAHGRTKIRRENFYLCTSFIILLYCSLLLCSLCFGTATSLPVTNHTTRLITLWFNLTFELGYHYPESLFLRLELLSTALRRMKAAQMATDVETMANQVHNSTKVANFSTVWHDSRRKMAYSACLLSESWVTRKLLTHNICNGCASW